MGSPPQDRLLLGAAVGAAVGAYVAWRLGREDGASRSARLLEDRQQRLSWETTGPSIPASPRKRSYSMPLSDPCPAVETKRSVRVQVPATSANLGSGYDTLGMALDMWNEVTVERSSDFSITVEGEGCDDIPLDETNLVVVGVKAVFDAIGRPMPTLRYHLKQRIPHGRGLGSSSAAIVGGILAALALTGHKVNAHKTEEFLQLALLIEGHPDNVAPAIYGGIQLGIFSERHNRWMTSGIPVPNGLIFVIFIPNFVGKTNELRKVVPKTVPIEDAVFNMGRTAWLVNCLLTGKTDDLREGFDDRLHQRQRGKHVYPHLYPLIDAAYTAGAVGAYLSGSGPCVMAITTGGAGDFFTQCDATCRKDAAVAAAMRNVADDLSIEGKVFVTHPAHTGGIVVEADPPYSTPLLAYNGET